MPVSGVRASPCSAVIGGGRCLLRADPTRRTTGRSSCQARSARPASRRPKARSIATSIACGDTAYAESKRALDSFTLGLVQEVGAEGIRVNAIRPRLIATDIHDEHGTLIDKAGRR